MATSFYYDKVASGNSYIGNTAAGGVVVPIYSATAQVFGIWNPQGNTKNSVLMSLDIGIQAIGTPVVGSYALCYQTNVGSVIAANNPITAATRGTAINALVGSNNQSSMYFIPATATFAAAPAILKDLGASNMTVTAANGIVNMHFDFFDAIALAPNSYVGVAGIVAPGSTCNISLQWYEQ